jgi:uncharacterized membrane protein YkvA (DUF1232 family)
MSLSAEDKIQVLQRFVDSFPADLLAVRDALGDATTPEAAQKFLIGGLNYAMDMLDIFPDNHKGIGIADDAMVLRLAAKLARDAGATHGDIERLATDANLITVMFDDLAGPLEKLVAKFPEREVRGRTAAKILSHKDTRIVFEADVGREAKRVKPAPIGTSGENATRSIIELSKMIEHALQRAGLV